MKKKLVIIGGGFAGSYIARKLERKFDVTIIDSKDYFEFTPGIIRTIVQPEYIRRIQILHTHYLKRAKVIVDCVTKIDKNHVYLGKSKIEFDYLTICSGSSYNVPFKEQNVVIVARGKTLRDYYTALCEAKEVVVVGGGLVGVEISSEIIEHYKDKKITIVHAKDRLIERNHEKAVRYADKFLTKRGIKIIYNERVISNKNGSLITNKKNKIKADLVLMCTGIVPNFEFMKGNFSKKLNKKNRIRVNDHLQVLGYKNIFAAGDITDRLEEKTAQNAKRQARVVVSNLLSLENNEKMKEYHSVRTPLVISLGRYDGIFSWGKFVFGGIIPGILKTFIERREMFLIRL